MKQVIIENSSEEQTLIKQAIALLSAFPYYNRIYSDRKSLVQLSASLLNSLHRRFEACKVDCEYLKSVFLKYYEFIAKDVMVEDKMTSFTDNSENISSLNTLVDDIQTNIKKFEQYIWSEYHINVTARNSEENNYGNLESVAAYGDSSALRYIYGDRLASDIEQAVKKKSEDFRSMKDLLYSTDSTFHKRLYYVIQNWIQDFKTQIEVYQKIKKTIVAYDLASIFFEEEMDYKSETLTKLLRTPNISDVEEMFKKYIIVR